jgi:hypothetical protein
MILRPHWPHHLRRIGIGSSGLFGEADAATVCWITIKSKSLGGMTAGLVMTQVAKEQTVAGSSCLLE